jgi:hypothetical protein
MKLKNENIETKKKNAKRSAEEKLQSWHIPFFFMDCMIDICYNKSVYDLFESGRNVRD